ncbi:MAG: DUF4919 domain-containing protein [Bacteroidales bacterium]|nr:DUF4919 domain-containing protein [Bacteroidales bacterium]
MKKAIICIAILIGTLYAWGAKTNIRAALGVPDMEAIAAASVDPASEYYYPRLLEEFLRNDTTMTNEQFQYFYYGTMFQEDYDPYREAPASALLQELLPIYAKDKRTRAERNKMLDYADIVLQSNPVDLRQLTNRIYVYEQNGKYDLAKIWQFKLNHLLLVIAASGNGSDPQNAFVVVYPQHEYDFLNLSGQIATSQKFEAPYYDYIVTTRRDNGAQGGYYFNISELLNQYFIKHPGELDDSVAADK